jgi:hypothetical protein
MRPAVAAEGEQAQTARGQRHRGASRGQRHVTPAGGDAAAAARASTSAPVGGDEGVGVGDWQVHVGVGVGVGCWQVQVGVGVGGGCWQVHLGVGVGVGVLPPGWLLTLAAETPV